jgi:hypothetical protein
MKHALSTPKSIFTAVLLFLTVQQCIAATRTASVTGNWSSTATWGGSNVPTASDDVIINAGVTVTMDGNSGACTNMTIYGTANWTQGRTTNVGGNLIISGGSLSGNTGTLSVTGTFSVPAGTTAGIQGVNLTITGSSSIAGALNFNTNATGTKAFNGLTVIQNGGTWNNSVLNEAITFGGGLTNNGTFTSGTGTYTFSANQNVGGNNPIVFAGSATINSGIILTNNGNLTVTGTLTGGNNSATLINSASCTFTAGGAVLSNGTLTATAPGNTVVYNAAGTQTVKPTTYVNLTLAGTSSKTLTSATTVNGILSMEGSATASAAPTYATGSATLQYNTNAARTAGAEWITPFAAAGGVKIINTGAITLNAAKVFNLSVPLNIASGATLNTSATNYALTFGGDFINSGGTLTANSSAITITNTMATQSIAGFSTLGTVTVSKASGTASLTGSITAASLTVSAAGILNLGSNLSHQINGAVSLTAGTLNGGTTTQLTLTGNWTNSSTFTAGTGSIVFGGSSAQTLSGTSVSAFYNLTANNAAGITLSKAASVSNVFTLSNGIVTSTTANSLSVTNTNTASVAGGGLTAYVSGPLIRSMIAGQSYLFPIGKGSIYLPMTLAGISGTNPQVSAEAFSGNTGGTASSPLTALSTTEYWYASVTSGTFTGASVSVTRQSALNALESLARNTNTLAGSYTTLNGTASGTSILNSDNTGSSLGYFVMASKRSITTGTISPLSFCPGSSVNVPYTITGTFTAGNIFTAQLSDVNGAFGSPISIGSVMSTTSGTISAVIPVSQAAGSAYRIRVVSSSPVLSGSDNGSNITIAVPQITSTSMGFSCTPGPITISATATAGATINWYANATGGSPLFTGPEYTAPNVSSSTTFYVDASFGTCTSSPRIPVDASVIPASTINAGGGGTYCYGSDITLTSGGTGVVNQYWQGPNGFYSLDANPVIPNATEAMAGTYTVTGSVLSSFNLLVNGDFEAGDVGFTSAYIDSNYLWQEGTYAVVASPKSVHPNFIACGNHTTGGSLQMVVNGATTAGVKIWGETVNVLPNTNYQFTYWIQSVVAENPSQLQLWANGVPAGPIYTAILQTCQWKQFIYNWNSGSSTSVVLSLDNQNTIASGNDFALDDLNFQQVCVATPSDAPTASSVVVSVNPIVNPGTIGNAQTICRGTAPATLTSVTAGSGTGTISYEWQSDESGTFVAIPGATSATYTPGVLNATTNYRRRTACLSAGLTCYSLPSNTITITVNGPYIEAGGPSSACINTSVTLSGSSLGTNATSAAWSIISGGGTLSSTAQTGNPANVTYTPANGYTGSVTLRLTTNTFNGCPAIDDRIITVYPLATAVAGTALSTCSNSGAINITAGASATNYVSTTWTSSGTGTFTNAGSLTAATYAPSSGDITAGSVTLTLTATGNAPCSNAVSTKLLTITAMPAATISYSGSPFCNNLSSAQSVTRTGTSGGTYSASPSGLSINTSTGAVTPSTSTPGTYTITYAMAATGPCGAAIATTLVTVTALPTASISYAGTPFCTSISTPQAVTLTGTASYTGGTFSAAAGLTINSSTGAITPSSSTAGTYTVTYTVPAAGGCSSVIATTSVTITKAPVATFSYTGSPYCSNASNPSPTYSGGGVAGVFTSTTGLVFVSTATGQVNIAASTPGTYTVTNTIAAAGGCAQVVASNTITITALPTASISYSGGPFCTSIATPQPVIFSGTTGGTYSAAPSGLSINVSTGAITPTGSTAGTYTVTYTLLASGGCAVVTATTSVTITAMPTASISYAGNPFCTTVSSAQAVTLTGTAAYTGGTYSVSPSGLSLNTSTGAVTPSTSTPGTYTVTYTLPAAAGCSGITATTSVTVTKAPVATFSYTGSPYCSGASFPSPTFSGGGVAGIFSAPAGLVFVSTATGQVNLAASTPGTYTVTNTIAASGGCAQVTATSSITITLSPEGTFSYTGSPYCSNATNPSPTYISGGVAGTFSSTAGLVFVSTTTGQVNLSASTPGTYTITNTLPAFGGCGVITATSPITITALPTASISYPGSPFCSSLSSAQSVSLSGTSGGVYTASPTGLSINSSTGAITPSSSTPGSYTVTYTIAAGGGCGSVISTTSVTITTLPTASISYPGNPFCTTVSTPQPVTLTGTAAYTGGTFSASAGLTLNTTNGEITPSGSTPGTYTVSYTVPASGGCSNVIATTSVTITAMPVATFSFTGTPYCSNGTNPLPTFSGGGTAGVFTAGSGLVFVSAATGQVNLAASTPGTYTVTNTIAASGGCAQVSASSPITITALPAATILYTGSPFCNSLSAPQSVTLSGNTGGVFSASPAGLTIDPASGAVTPSTSTAGDYTVTYTLAAANGCEEVTATALVTVTPLPTASISYTGSPFYTTNSTSQTVVLTGTSGGTYSASPAGLSLDAISGSILPSASLPGVYTITYTLAASGGCSEVTATTSVTIINGYIITVSGSTGADGNYASLTNGGGAFQAINAQNQVGKSVIITITGNSSSESGDNNLNAGNWTSILMYPTVSGITVSGSAAKPMINLNGADRFTIDGRVNASGSTGSLIISNTSTSNSAGTSTLQFTADASNNTVQYCSIKGAETNTSSGVILFSTSSAGGNDNNTLTNNSISSASGNRPVYGIYSAGSSAANDNSSNTVGNNTFSDLLNPAIASAYVYLGTNTTAWTLSGNSFFETSPLAPSAAVAYSGITIANTQAGNFTINDNFIGGTDVACGGSAMVKTNTQNNVFTGISISTGTTTANSIQGNTIQNISWSNNGTAAWTGIQVAGGMVNVGTVTGNTIGSGTGTGSLTFSGGATNSNFYGISISSTGTVDCQNNTIGAVAVSNAAANATNFYGIYKTGTAGTTTISGNLIGSNSTANSVQSNSVASTSGNAQSVFGINSAGTGTVTIGSNTVANLTNSTTNTNTGTAGLINGIAASAGTLTISGNTIHDLTIANRNTSATNTASICGIALSGTTLRTVSGNTIYNLSNTNTGFAGNVTGLYFTGGTGANAVSGNYIQGLSVNASTTTTNIYGIKMASGATTYSNNIVSISGSMRATVYGIYETGAANNNNSLYFNTVYLGGNVASGTNKSYAFYSNANTNIRNLRNNIFVNTRSTTGGASLHYAAYFNYATPTNLTSNYNDYYISGTGSVLGFYNGANVTALPLVPGNDANSQNVNPAFVNAGGSAAADYKPGVHLSGVAGTGITADYGSFARLATPTMGAWERFVINKWKGSVSTAWNISGNWTDNYVPATDDDIIFDDVPVNHCILDQDRSVGSITNAQPTYQMVLNGKKLTVKGSLLFSANARINASAAGSNIEFAGAAAQSIPSGAFANDEVYTLTINNAGNLSLNGTLRILSSIQPTLGRFDAYTNAATVVFAGSTAQSTGSPFLNNQVYNFGVDNLAGVSLSGNLTISGTAVFTSGTLNAGANTLTFINADVPVSRTSGTLTTDPATNLVFGTTGNTAGTAFTLPNGLFTGSPVINNLTINRTNSLSLNNQMLSLRGILLCTAGTLNTAGNLTLLSSASQTALIDGSGAGTVSGNVTMQRYLPSGFGYKYVSSPFTSATVNELSEDLDLSASFPTFYAYDEDHHRDSLGFPVYSTGWVNYVATTGVLNPGKGYAGNFGTDASPKTIDITGIVNNGTLSAQTLISNNRTYTKGFHLLGNPYPSPIDWNSASGWSRTNIDNALYFFDAGTTNQYTGTYSTYINGISSNGIAGSLIPSMQGFFVHVTDGFYPVTASIQMDNQVRTTSLSPAFHKSGYVNTQPKVRMAAGFDDTDLNDPMVVYFENTATQQFDPETDALKLMNTDYNVPSFYSLGESGERLSISSIAYPVDSVTHVGLGVRAQRSGKLNFTLVSSEFLPSGLRVYLSDKNNGQVQDIQLNPKVQVQLEAGQYDSRFELLFSTKNLTHTLNGNHLFDAYLENARLAIHIRLASEQDGNLRISNLLGQTLYEQNCMGDGILVPDLYLPTGFYVVTLYTQTTKQSQKIYIPVK